MGYKYAVLGAGRQGLAAAYDMCRFGEADQVLLVDMDKNHASDGANRLNALVGKDKIQALELDCGDVQVLARELDGVSTLLSALPYKLNKGVTNAAIRIGANMCDLGGHTGIVREQLGRDVEAKDAGISIVPDCGMGPGLNISLATYAMSCMDAPRDVYIWDGGLPQHPGPPWNYTLTFNVNGLTNEYFGNAFFLRNGRITQVPCFEGYETLKFPDPLGTLEAFVTSGGLSTAPWTFEGTLRTLENKTLRYPGHCQQFRAFSQLGLFEEDEIAVMGKKIVPRDVYHTLLEPRISMEEVHDVCVMRIRCLGEKAGQESEVILDLVDRFDEETGFTAMQRLTGWHASIMAILATYGKIQRGAVPVEQAIAGKIIVEEARKRGIRIKEYQQ